jgi:hypothetical protein
MYLSLLKTNDHTLAYPTKLRRKMIAISGEREREKQHNMIITASISSHFVKKILSNDIILALWAIIDNIYGPINR